MHVSTGRRRDSAARSLRGIAKTKTGRFRFRGFAFSERGTVKNISVPETEKFKPIFSLPISESCRGLHLPLPSSPLAKHDPSLQSSQFPDAHTLARRLETFKG